MKNLNPSNDRNHDLKWTELDGIQVDELAQYDRLSITTANNIYEIVLLHPETAEVLVRGGSYFPHETRAYLAGSSLSLSIKPYGVYVGHSIEFFVDGHRVKTSPVRKIQMYREADLAA